MRKRKVSPINTILLVMLTMTLLLSVIRAIFKSNDEPIAESHEPQINFENIIDIDGIYSYEDRNYTSRFGIDISEFQDDIDWQKVKNAGVEFIYMRLGRRGASTGIIYLDDSFEENYQKAKEYGFTIGVYFFSQAINAEEAREEARFVINQLKHKKIDLPVVYDLEDVYLPQETVRTEGLSGTIFTENALAFCKEIEKANYEAMIYTNIYWSQSLYDMDRLSDYPIWLALYEHDKPDIDYPIAIWQYTNKGKIDGIKADVDFDIMFIRK